MVHLSFQQYCKLVDLRLMSEMQISKMEVVPLPDPRLFSRYDYMSLFNDIVDDLLNRYRLR